MRRTRGQRWCKHCGKPLAGGKRIDAEYCDKICKSRYHNEKRREAYKKLLSQK